MVDLIFSFATLSIKMCQGNHLGDIKQKIGEKNQESHEKMIKDITKQKDIGKKCRSNSAAQKLFPLTDKGEMMCPMSA